MDEPDKRLRRSLRLPRLRLGPTSVLVPLFYFGGLFAGGMLYPGYNHITQLPSELGALGAPHPLVFNASLILTGVSLCLVSLAFHRALRGLGARPVWARSLGISLMIPAVYFGVVGLIALPDPRHNAAFPLLLPMHAAPFLLAKGLSHRLDLRQIAWYLATTGLAMLVLLAIALGLGNMVSPRNAGLFIRIYAAAAFVWIGIVGPLLARQLDRDNTEFTVSAT